MRELDDKSNKDGKKYISDKGGFLYIPDHDGLKYIPDKDGFKYIPDKDGFLYIPDHDGWRYIPNNTNFKPIPDKKVTFWSKKEKVEMNDFIQKLDRNPNTVEFPNIKQFVNAIKN